MESKVLKAWRSQPPRVWRGVVAGFRPNGLLGRFESRSSEVYRSVRTRAGVASSESRGSGTQKCGVVCRGVVSRTSLPRRGC